MKKRVIAVVIATVALAALVGSAPVSAATPTDKRVAALEKQVKALTAQVKSLKTQVTVLRKTAGDTERSLRDELARGRIGDACMAVAVADLFQATWRNVDQRVTSGPVFGPQEQMYDPACMAPGVGIARPGIQNAPTVSVFSALIGWLIG